MNIPRAYFQAGMAALAEGQLSVSALGLYSQLTSGPGPRI